MAKRMRLPNGFGQISEIKGRRMRNRFRAMVTVRWTNEGKPVRYIVGYYHTYNEAYEALMEYHKTPHDKASEITMQELFDEWSVIYFKKNPNREQAYSATWNRCERLHDEKVCEVKSWHIKDMVEGDFTPTMQKLIKCLLNLMFDYAVEMEYTDKNYARITKSLIIDKTANEHHIPFNDIELASIWEMDGNVRDIILIQAYGGWRPSEVLNLKKENIHLKEGYIIGGSKTKAGKNRMVPIHSRIMQIIETRYNVADNAIFSGYDYYCFRRDVKKIGNHKPHDGRATFVTNAKKCGMDEYAIKRIVGHTITDITEDVYTTRDIQWLSSEMEKLTI